MLYFLREDASSGARRWASETGLLRVTHREPRQDPRVVPAAATAAASVATTAAAAAASATLSSCKRASVGVLAGEKDLPPRNMPSLDAATGGMENTVNKCKFAANSVWILSEREEAI